jgi:glycosyltransferase involved in cell wall biosynthesis
MLKKTNKIKIVFVLPLMSARGVEKSLIELLDILSMNKDRLDVTVMLVEKTGDFLNLIPNWVKVEELPIPDDLRIEVNNITYCTDKIKKAIKQMKIGKALGIVYRRKRKIDPSGGLSYSLHELSKTDYYDIAVCYHIHCPFLIRYVEKNIPSKCKIAWIHNDFKTTGFKVKNYRDSFKNYDRIYGVSQQIIDEFIDIIPECKDKTKLFLNIIPKNKIIEKALEYYPDEFVECKRLNLPILLSVGNLTSQKGYDVAVDVAKILKERNVKFKWFVIGDGEDREKIQGDIEAGKIQNEMILLGLRLNPYPYMKGCDLFILTSKHEGFGLVLAEAKALCRPVITTDVAGAREQFVNGQNGIICSHVSTDIADAIENLINSNNKRKLMTNVLREENKINDENPFASNIGLKDFWNIIENLE